MVHISKCDATHRLVLNDRFRQKTSGVSKKHQALQLLELWRPDTPLAYTQPYQAQSQRGRPGPIIQLFGPITLRCENCTIIIKLLALTTDEIQATGPKYLE
jgi:hypothetical protein